MSTCFDELFNKIHEKNSQQSPSESGSFDELFQKVQEKQPSRTRSILSAPIKGALRGAQNFSLLPSFGPISKEMGENIIEKLLPTQNRGLEQTLEFAGENIPVALMGEGGLAKKGIQALAGGIAKKGAKDVDLPEWAQEVIGGAGMAVPGALQAAGTKALRPSTKQQAVFDFLKSKGLSDKDITPIIQNNKKLSFLSKAAFKYEKEQPWLKGIKKDIGNIFEDIRERGRQSGYLDGKQLLDFEDAFYDKLDKVPRMYRGLIKKEVEDLFQSPINFTELHDFDKAVNAIVKDVEGGKAAIGILKEPIKQAQKKMNPTLYKELESTNLAYGKLANFTDKMTKKDWDALIKLGEAGAGLYALLSLNTAGIGTAAGVVGTQVAARQILSNPRLQNIHLKMWDSFLNGKMTQTLKLADLLKSELEKE
jgi:hypothetical protein